MNKIIGILVVCLFLAFPCFGANAEPSLVVGTNAEFPPFTFIQKGEIVGFDIDIAKEVAKKLGREIKLKDMPFDSLIPDLILGRVDFVAAGMSYSKERAQRVNFTQPYLQNDPLVVLTLTSKKTSGSMTLEQLSEKLAGKTIIVNEGFTADLALTPLKGFTLIRLTTTADGFLALKSGRADVFVTAKSTVDSFLVTQKNGQEFHLDVIEGSSDDCVLAVPKKYPEMLVRVQAALDEMEKEGTIAKLKAKWKFSD